MPSLTLTVGWFGSCLTQIGVPRGITFPRSCRPTPFSDTSVAASVVYVSTRTRHPRLDGRAFRHDPRPTAGSAVPYVPASMSVKQLKAIPFIRRALHSIVLSLIRRVSRPTKATGVGRDSHLLGGTLPPRTLKMGEWLDPLTRFHSYITSVCDKKLVISERLDNNGSVELLYVIGYVQLGSVDIYRAAMIPATR